MSAIVEDVIWEHVLANIPVDAQPFGSLIIVGTSDGDAVVLDGRTGAQRAQVTCEGGILGVAPSPGGDRVAITGPFGAWLWDGADAAPLGVVRDEWCSVARWVNAERWALARGKRVAVYSSAGEELWVAAPLPSTVSDVVWLGGRHRLAAAVYGGVHVIEARRHGPSTHLAFKGSLLALAASPNGKWIVSGNQDASLQVFRTDKDTRLEMQGYPAKITRVAFDQSGRWLANNGAPEVSIWDFAGAGPRGRSPVLCVSPQPSDQPTVFSWHAAAARLAIGWASGTVSCVSAASGVPGQPSIGSVICQPSAGVTALAWCKDDLLVTRQDGTVSMLRHGEVAAA